MDPNETINTSEQTQETGELSHTDKIVGVISEPSELFSKLAFLKTKATDWLLPLIALIIVAIITTVLYMSNPEIKLEMMQQQQKALQEQFDKMVESGQMTRQQADEQLNKTAEVMGDPMFAILFPAIGIIFMMFLWFFVFTTVAFLIAKYVLGGSGTYSQAMTSMGLPLYISVLGAIVAIILSLIMGKMITGVNPASLTGIDIKSLQGFILSRFDVFAIWFYVVLGIAFAKMFKSDNVKKYVFTSIGFWLVFMFIIFGLSQVSTFFGNMIR